LIKTDSEIAGIRKSSKLSADVLVFIKPFVKAGVTTLELNNLIEDFIRKNGGIPAPLNYKSFPAATCISVNNFVCHGIPDGTVIKNGDIVGIDVATIVDGYYGDTCFTYPVGEVSHNAAKLLQVAKNSLYIGIKQVKNGNYLGNIGYEISRYVNRCGFSVCSSFTGHGVGLEFHESPTIYHEAEKDSGQIIDEGMTFTIEPIINTGSSEIIMEGWPARTKDGGMSAQFEHTILVCKNHAEILTDSEIWL
jgi:methionyl aminopeptidase